MLCTRWCCDVRDALRLSGLHNTFSPAVFTPHTQKSPSVRMGFFTLFDAGSLWRASCPPPSGPLLRNVQIRSRRICPPQESAHRQTTDKTKGPVFRPGLCFYLMPWQFPTLAWGDPTLPSALRRFTSEFGMGSGGTTALQPPGKFCYRPLMRSDVICIKLNVVSSPKHLRRCKVKPHGSLVSVSSMYRYAYTPALSTSSSSTFLQETYSLRENSSRGKFRA